MKPYTVLVPTDGSAFSFQIIPYVCRLLIPREHSIILLRVEPPLLDYAQPSPPSPRDIPAAPPPWVTTEDPELTRHPSFASQTLDSLHAALLQSLEPCSRYLEEAGFTVEREVRFGDAVEEIVAFAEEAKVDMMAMATHGRSGLSRLTMGSTADEVLRRSHIPVLVVRPSATASREHSEADKATEPA
jgi:nucleotide-binding universal stress UspA family protein